jgi:NAD(P)-dependent dehydrogenase (short-subunit alcohol dehydrogenase family)
MLLDGRVAVVTGSGRGIGRAFAIALAEQGAKVVVNDVGAALDGRGTEDDPAHQVCKEIEALGGEAVPSYDSVSDFEGAGRIIGTAVDAFGQIDILVNNAGIVRDRTLLKMGEDDFDAVVAVHLKGTFCTTRWAAAYWRERAKAGETNDARIINTSSGSGLYNAAGQGNYGAAKAGIASLSIIAAKELAPYGVTANAIAPGARTRMTESVPERPGRQRRNEPGDGEFDARDPGNVAPLVVWLGSSESKDITGQVFNVSGGNVGVAINWQRGPAENKGERWDPTELGAIIPKLVEQAGTAIQVRT